MAENSSLRKTFSTSRFAIMLPAVARRSPASTTPPSQTAATMVVACGRSRMAWPGVPCDHVGRDRAAGQQAG